LFHSCVVSGACIHFEPVSNQSVNLVPNETRRHQAAPNHAHDDCSAAFVIQQMTNNDPAMHDQGVGVVLDFRNAPLKLIRQFSIADLKRGIGIWRYSPVKVKIV
jgi:hypothetical protein